MDRAARKPEYVDYDYLSEEEAAYQGYDVEEDSYKEYGFSIIDSELNESRRNKRKI